MKKRLLITLVIAVGLVAALTLTACQPKDTHKGKQEVQISTAQGLIALKDNLGTDYDQTSYKLMADIDLGGESWTPIGKGANDAFYSNFDGNGHTISGVRIDNQAVAARQGSMVTTGFFGFTVNSKITNLTIDIDYDFVFDNQIMYAGGLVGYAFGDTEIDNVTVNGSLIAKLATNPAKEEVSDDSKIYIGGIVGSSTGNIIMDNLTNNAEITVSRNKGSGTFGDEIELNRAHTAYAGGIAGYIRTVDLSIRQNGDSPKGDNIAQNLTNNGDITIFADRLNAGGIIGSLYNSSIAKDLLVSNQSAMLFDASLRVNAGGVIGYADSAAISDIVCDAVVLEVARKKDNQEVNKIFNVGGLVGYAANGTVISTSDVDTIIMLDGNVDFAGGLVGVLADSGIKDCTVKGKFINKSQSGWMYDVFGDPIEKNTNGEYVKVSGVKDKGERKWAGGVAKLFGGKTASDNGSIIGQVSDIDIDIEAYYAIFCAKVERVKAIDGAKDANGKQAFEYYNSSLVADNIIYTAEKIKEVTMEATKQTSLIYGNARQTQDE